MYLSFPRATMPRMSSFSVTHRTNSRSRSVRVTISPEGGVIVTRPPRFPQWRAEQFVEQSHEWIEKQLRKQKIQHSVFSVGKSFSNLLYKGLPYPVEVVEQGPPVEVVPGKIHVNPVENTTASIHRALERWLKAESERQLVVKIHKLAKDFDVVVKNVVLKSASSRWGSCSSTGNINLHWRLIQAPEAVADYVIIHELAHRKEMNHSPRFWKLVETHDPEYRSHRTWLQKHGILLQTSLWA